MRTSLPVECTVDGTKVRGQIVVLHPGELHIRLLEPYGKISGSIHEFFRQKAKNSYVEKGELTAVGKESAEYLLESVYIYADYFAKHIEELRRFYEPLRSRIQFATERLKSTLPEAGSKRLQEHQAALQEVLWLNNEYYLKITKTHVSLSGIGMDTLMDLTDRFL